MKTLTTRVLLRGAKDIMFDRYAGDNKTSLRPDQKFYFAGDGETLVLPALNILSFLAAQNTPSAVKRFQDSRKYKKTAQAITSYTQIEPDLIPFTRDGEPIRFGAFDVSGRCEQSGCYVRSDVARLDKGIPNPKVRPVLPTPWELRFTLRLIANQEVNETELQNLFIHGGLAIGLGTFRGVFGKFTVEQWETT